MIDRCVNSTSIQKVGLLFQSLYNSCMTSEDNFFTIEKYKDFVYPSIYIGDDEIIIVFLILNDSKYYTTDTNNFDK